MSNLNDLIIDSEPEDDGEELEGETLEEKLKKQSQKIINDGLLKDESQKRLPYDSATDQMQKEKNKKKHDN